ncbi:MAG: hypothetical protein WBI17_07200 [Clostridiaceae bacterium]
MKKLIQDLIKSYEQSLRDMAGANVECRDNYGRDIFSEDHMNTVKAFLFDLILLLDKVNAEVKPMKPRYFTDMYGHRKPGCPGCPKDEILYAGQKFCSVCGTKFDWGKDE